MEEAYRISFTLDKKFTENNAILLLLDLQRQGIIFYEPNDELINQGKSENKITVFDILEQNKQKAYYCTSIAFESILFDMCIGKDNNRIYIGISKFRYCWFRSFKACENKDLDMVKYSNFLLSTLSNYRILIFTIYKY